MSKKQPVGMDGLTRAERAAAAGQPAKVEAAPSSGASPLERFRTSYEATLRQQVQANPGKYGYGIDRVPEMARRMTEALAIGGGDHTSPTVKAVVKSLGIKPTVGGIKAFLNDQPPPAPKPQKSPLEKAQAAATKAEAARAKAWKGMQAGYVSSPDYVKAAQAAEVARKALDAVTRIGKTWTDGNGVTHTWTAESETAHQDWAARTQRTAELMRNGMPIDKAAERAASEQDAARTKSAEVRKNKAGSNARSAGGKAEKVTQAKATAAPKYEVVDKQTGKVVGKAGSLKRALDSVNKRDRDHGGSRFMHRKVDASPQPSGDRTSARPATADSLNQNHLKGTQNPNNLKAIVEGKKGRAKASKTFATGAEAERYFNGKIKSFGESLRIGSPEFMSLRNDTSSLRKLLKDVQAVRDHAHRVSGLGSAAIKPTHIIETDPALGRPITGSLDGMRDQLAGMLTDASKRIARRDAAKAPKAAADPHTPAPVKAPKAKRGAGAKKALGLLAPVAIGAAMLSAADEAKAQGTSQAAAAAKEGAAGAGGMAVFMGGTAAATAGLVKVGMTAARAVPVVQGALMAGGALKGAWDARKGGAGAMAAGAAKGAWDMSLPGMVVNTGLAAKEAVQGRMAVTAAPSAAPASFQAASERFHAMRAAAATSDAGEKKKGWSNAARIGAYKARMAKSGSNAANLPYGGALTPPKPLKG